MEKIYQYQRPLWICVVAYLGMFIIGTLGLWVITISHYREERDLGLVIFIICEAWVALFSKSFFSWIRNFAKVIVINDSERAIISYQNIKKQEKFIRIRWSDIIAIYTVKIFDTWDITRRKIFLVIPSAKVDEKYNEVINFEVKINKEGEKAKAYYDWLIVHHKGIKIFKEIRDYRELLREICIRAPHIVIDNEIKKLIRK